VGQQNRALVQVLAFCGLRWRTSRPDQTELPFENPPEQGTG
jgi:hypothetical protein